MNRREPADSPFRDLSNLRAPRPSPKPVPASPLFFAASKTPLQAPTPTPLRRRRPGAGAPTPTPLGRRLRALEADQLRSARRAESGGERALRTFAASASSWLSLLLRDPSACGCSPATGSAASQPCAAGKRDALDGERANGGRSPKRRRGGDLRGERRKGMTPVMAAALRDSLREACSLDDVTERMGRHMSKDACEEVLVMMYQICKNIDEGRLKMKAHCPLVTDLRLKEKAIRIFMCYNPEWLRIGLHIVLGGDSLLPNGSGKKDKEVPFLKLILEKQMFGQIMTAKSSAHNKVAQGLHRQGYSEPLGNIILKRIFLLVAALDRAKIESALPGETGIDGLDGGSPLLFYHQDQIKSSRQIIQESLGEAMHGEGDLLIHLATMGYKLSYQQPALSEYDFTIRSLFEDLQDGIIICRVVQLLLSDASIILKVTAPSDTHKKKLHNCTVAIQYIKQAGVPLSDSDGVTISAEDIATGDKELILSLLWNVFIHMQLPLLANTTSLAQEVTRLKVLTEQLISESKSHIGLLYDWVQVICSKNGMKVEIPSQFDRRALNCLINYYLDIDIIPLKDTLSGCRKELFTSHELDTITDIASCPSSKMGKVLADFLQDIPASSILADDVLFDEKSAILLLAFLSSYLTNDKRLDQLKNFINMRLDHQSPETKISARCRCRGEDDVKYQSPRTNNKDGSEWAATIIQTHARSIIAKNKYCKRKKAIFILQGALRAWSAVIMKRNRSCLAIAASTPWKAHGNYNRHFVFIIERRRFVQMRKSSIMIQQAVRIWIRGRKSHDNNEPFKRHEFLETTTPSETNCIAPAPLEQRSGQDKTIASATPSQHCERVDTLRASAAPHLCFDAIDCLDSATPLQLSDKPSNPVTSAIQLCKSGRDCIDRPSPLLSMFESSRISTVSCQLCEVETSNVVSATKLVCEDDVDCGGKILSRTFFKHEQPVSTWIDFPVFKEVVAVQRIQSAYRRFLHNRNLRVAATIKIQSHWRGLSVRKCFTRQVQAIIAIQTSTRLFLYHRAFQRRRLAAILIQQVVRGWLARKRLLGSSLQTYRRLCVLDQSQHKKCHQSLELKIVLHSVLRLQRWWRKFLLHQSIRTSVISIQSFVRGWLARKQLNRVFCCINIIQRWWRKHLFLESRKKSVIVIQAHFRGWIARQAAIRNRKRITTIQSYVKAYLVRKASKQEVTDIRSRLLKSSAQVDDSMRLINRLVAALSQLLRCRSISSIRQTCATLSTATEYSEKCCETLVNAGAVDILLKQIHLLNRGIPDQEVLKQVLLSLRNIAHYPNHLRMVLVNNPESVEIIFHELLRNKKDGFFIAADILKKFCESKEGHETARTLQYHTRRLRNLVQDLEKKVELDKRNGRTGAVKENNLRRLGEAATLYNLLTSDH
ncbi:uncharacterized protein LOC133893568 isoform X2 [Phragmites australis]|uniref:uncharacterized protein LOC133893568 isoform X2 n=1 Tax=Phragmites australis TaxID=29695 RepID=UPI002D798ABA|nr:uncharacterized protein LOC133893568 isoform X2 [Phragmites australis]